MKKLKPRILIVLVAESQTKLQAKPHHVFCAELGIWIWEEWERHGCGHLSGLRKFWEFCTSKLPWACLSSKSGCQMWFSSSGGEDLTWPHLNSCLQEKSYCLPSGFIFTVSFSFQTYNRNQNQQAQEYKCKIITTLWQFMLHI